MPSSRAHIDPIDGELVGKVATTAVQRGFEMLFAAIYKPHETSEETQKRSLSLFMQWSPPFEFKAHYARGDGKGGITIIESDSAEAIVEGINTWAPFFDFEVTPVTEIESAVPLLQRAFQWRDSVG